MFLCGNFCNNLQQEPEIVFSNLVPAKTQPPSSQQIEQTVNNSTLMIKKSKYLQHLQNCKKNNSPFIDEQFPPNQKSLNFRIEGRSIIWKRISQILKEPLMVQNNIEPADIQQGNIGDCYFLASISALAEEPIRIQTIFHDNFQVNGYGIYKLAVNFQGCLTEIVIDDFVPVFSTTDRPVFCKPKGRQIWVMLLEKAWAKIKGSYGNISAGCPHEVLNTFSVAPCFYFQVQEQMSADELESVWGQLLYACELNLPICAGSKPNVTLPGVKPQHTYTVLDCGNVPSGGRNHKIMRMRNPWGNTEYTGYASESDVKFWNQAPLQYKQKLIPSAGSDDGDFSIPFSQFVKHFQSVDVCVIRPNFSYQFETLTLIRKQPLFIRLQVYEQHEAYLTVQKSYGQQSSKEQSKYLSNYGHTRMVIAHQIDSSNYEYYSSKLQTNFPDLTLICPRFKPGQYLIMIDADFPQEDFTTVFSYYYSNGTNTNNKNYEVIKGTHNQKYLTFMESVFQNHAIRVNGDRIKIGPKPEDWVKTHLMYEEGGYGYVAFNLESTTSIKLLITIEKEIIQANGFQLIGYHESSRTVEAGQQGLILFSYNFGHKTIDNINFPPAGFKISRIV